ncbi:hypothetical protein MF271_22535 (plasmid) [Deinococcus sp. KNUC1210]|uniref:hypothetical protein n=1 Tax=Deinococcus sp. KNUC1210 TaxID=2917691 RepID=UPI001EF0DFEE|nr:hypothetical protein [Deinococcus sp. KNUC1210]ULH18246.1 hypothetical protein MF271_22535 [Deinococcus sp. KNUC1210]
MSLFTHPTFAHLLLLPALLLAACGNLGAPTIPAVTAAPISGAGGVYQISFQGVGSPEMSASVRSVKLSGVQTEGLVSAPESFMFERVANSTFVVKSTATRHVEATFKVTNTSTTTLNNLKFLPVVPLGKSSIFSNLTYFDGSDASSKASTLTTTQGKLLDVNTQTTTLNPAASAYLTGLDISGLNAAALGVSSIQPVGWQVATTLAAGGMTYVTFGVDLPADASSRNDPFSFSLNIIPVQDSVAAASQVTRSRQILTIDGAGIAVDTYTWPDANGHLRSVSLKRQGEGNSGNGGYAVQFTYPGNDGSTVTIQPDTSSGDGGFGYFVSHEASRRFADGSSDTIASKFGDDDSPLGLGFPVTSGPISLAEGSSAAIATHTFNQLYPRYGTLTPLQIAYDANGNETDQTPTNAAQLKKYQVPLAITWTFTAGKNYPKVTYNYDLTAAHVPVDATRFDVRGPYGVMKFDVSGTTAATKINWGDGFYKFQASNAAGLTWNTAYTWNTAWSNSRFQALVFGNRYEMGLFEPLPQTQSQMTDGYSESRGTANSARLPVDFEWPYQSLNYSLNETTPTTGKKLAWGSSPFFGSSLGTVYAGNDLPQPFPYGQQAQGKTYAPAVKYSICIVLGQGNATTTLTEQAAVQAQPSC